MIDNEATHLCDRMRAALGDEDTPIRYNPKFREYGIRILDGGSSWLLITHCPFDGAELPTSLRDAWFDELERLGLEPRDSAIPAEMDSDAWWRSPGETDR